MDRHPGDGKEASMKVEPFMAYGAENDDGPYSVVHVARYDALLTLARRLRIELVSYAKDAPVMCDDIELLDDSAWLEE